MWVFSAIIVFPSWPCSRAVKFKLAAPGNTTVELDYDGKGALRLLDVQPAARNSSLIFANCVAGSHAATAVPQHPVEKSDDDAIAAFAHMRSRSRSPSPGQGRRNKAGEAKYAAEMAASQAVLFCIEAFVNRAVPGIGPSMEECARAAARFQTRCPAP